jgi:hypothetical protein
MDGRSSLIAVRHHQILPNTSKLMVCLKFIMISVDGTLNKVKQKK